MEILRRTAIFKLDQQTKNVPAAEVSELSFATVPLAPLVDLLKPFANLKKLTLVSMKPQLTSMMPSPTFPLHHFPELTLLDLSDNKIGDELLSSIEQEGASNLCAFQKLRRLYLTNNCISATDTLKVMAKLFPNVEVLEINDNPIVSLVGAEELRALCFNLWHKLTAVDAFDASGIEVEVLDSDEDEESSDESSEEESESSDEASEESDDDNDEPSRKEHRVE